MTAGFHKTNCTLSAPGWGSFKLAVTELSYGKSIVSSQTEGRRFASFYPRVATSGEWSVTAVFPTWAMCNSFMVWIAGFNNRVTDTSRYPLLPITVSVPSQGFRKSGYPAVVSEFGDEFGKVVWTVKIPFVSASEPQINGRYASKYAPSLREGAISAAMAPAGIQDSSVVRSPYRPAVPPSNGDFQVI